MPFSWYPSQFFDPLDQPTTPYAIIILNQPINTNTLTTLSKHASFIICADGGGNHFHDQYLAAKDHTNDHSTRLPDAVIGDLDSLREDARKSLETKGVQIIKDPDQNSTDFGKCLKWLRDNRRNQDPLSINANAIENGDISEQPLDVLVMGGLNGRLDQGLSTLHYLYTAISDPSLLNGRIYFLTEQSLAFFFDLGVNEIHFPKYPQPMFTENVGIIPISGPTSITTTGLEWDVSDWRTEFGSGLMSTSNHIKANIVTVEVKEGKKPLFTVELAGRLCMGGSS